MCYNNSVCKKCYNHKGIKKLDDNKLEAKLLKIKALAERGEGGEKEAAIKMYHKLLKKYDIDEKALQKDKLSKHWFTYETDIEENLLVQIFTW